MRYDRVRKNLDRHPNYILAIYMATGTLTASVPSGKEFDRSIEPMTAWAPDLSAFKLAAG
jgi:hypothetical protein